MKLVASDIDGTILAHNGSISPRTVAAFKACLDAGVEVVFVTGRPPRWLAPLRDQLGHLGTVICSNGALVYDLAAERVVSSQCISIPDVLAAREAIKQVVPSASFAAETLEGLYLEPDFVGENAPEALKQIPARPLAESLKEECGVIKFLAKVQHSTADEFLAKVRQAVSPWVDATHSAPDVALLEMSLRGVNKAAALSQFAASKGITADQVVAFGDMPNDIQMLSWSGHGYAMASGHPEAKQAANLLAPGIEDDGVAQILEQLLLEGV